MLDYYARRATEYEQVYDKPERQTDLAILRLWVAEAVRGRRVLELACGTGYWTAVMAQTADFLLATDLSTEVLALARERSWPPARVAFARADAMSPPRLAGEFDAVFAGFWWSHLRRQERAGFLQRLAERLGSGVEVILIDNRFVPGSSTPIARIDQDGNSWQRRRLADGSEHEVLKNFPDPAELLSLLQAHGTQVEVFELPHYWMARYRTTAWV